MDVLCTADEVRLRSHNKKFLCAGDDGRTVRLVGSKTATEVSTVWQVVHVSLDQRRPIVRLKSRQGSLLRAAEREPVSVVKVMAGWCKVVQCWQDPMDFSVDWEPVREGFQVRFMNRKSGGFLRAPAAWRNAVTHEALSGSSKGGNYSNVMIQECFLWDVETAPEKQGPSRLLTMFTSLVNDDHLDSRSNMEDRSITSSRSSTVDTESPSSLSSSMREPNERVISFTMATDESSDEDANLRSSSITFQGNDLQEMRKKLEEATGLHDIVICGKNSSDGEVFPLRLPLPPGNLPMSVVLVQSPKRPSHSTDHLENHCLADYKGWEEFSTMKNMDFVGGAKRMLKKALLNWERPKYSSYRSS